MKKLVFAAVAAIALTASVSFVSCGNAAPAADTVATDSIVADTVCADTVCADSCCADSCAADSAVAE